jgi:hypothetical protein
MIASVTHPHIKLAKKLESLDHTQTIVIFAPQRQPLSHLAEQPNQAAYQNGQTARSFVTPL